MRKKDRDLLWMFTLRIGMYTGKENQDTISAFLLGYEIGRGNNCHFIKKLSASIEKELKIKNNSTGWVGQIENAAHQLETEWVTIFKRHSLKVLTNEFDETTKKTFQDSLRKRINGKLTGMVYSFDKHWIADWFGLTDLSASWFKEIWSREEFALIEEIEIELTSLGKISTIVKGIQPTEKLKNICMELLQKLEQ